jgi:hypothetical protein
VQHKARFAGAAGWSYATRNDLYLAITGDMAGAEHAEGSFEDMPAHDLTAFVEQRHRRECAQVRIKFRVI